MCQQVRAAPASAYTHLSQWQCCCRSCLQPSLVEKKMAAAGKVVSTALASPRYRSAMPREAVMMLPSCMVKRFRVGYACVYAHAHLLALRYQASNYLQPSQVCSSWSFRGPQCSRKRDLTFADLRCTVQRLPNRPLYLQAYSLLSQATFYAFNSDWVQTRHQYKTNAYQAMHSRASEHPRQSTFVVPVSISRNSTRPRGSVTYLPLTQALGRARRTLLPGLQAWDLGCDLSHGNAAAAAAAAIALSVGRPTNLHSASGTSVCLQFPGWAACCLRASAPAAWS